MFQSYGDAVELITGESVKLTTDETYRDRCSTYTIFVDFAQFAEQLKKGDIVLLDNESISLKVEVISLTTLTCKIERGGFLGSDKDVFVPKVIFTMSDYTDKIKKDLDIALQCKVSISCFNILEMNDHFFLLSSFNPYTGTVPKKCFQY